MSEEEEVDDQLLWNLQILSEVKILFCFVTVPPLSCFSFCPSFFEFVTNH